MDRWIDVRTSFRRFQKRPFGYLTLILVLALGVASITTICRIVDAVWWHPLPFPDASHLVQVTQAIPARGWDQMPLSMMEVEAFSNVDAFDDVGHYAVREATIRDRATDRVRAAVVSQRVVPIFGLHIIAGRAFMAADGRLGADAVGIIAETLWQRLFGREPSAVGRTVYVDDAPVVIAGIVSAPVMPPGLIAPVELLVNVQPQRVDRTARDQFFTARLRPGSGVDAARSQVRVVSARLSEAFPALNKGYVADVTPVHSYMLGYTGPRLTILLAAGVLVLLLVCTNAVTITALHLATRRQEFSMKIAIGATRLRLAREVITEGVVLGLLVAAVALPLTAWAVNWTRTLGPIPEVPRLEELRFDWIVAGSTIGLSIFISMLVMLASLIHMLTRLTPDFPSVVQLSRIRMPIGRFARRAFIIAQTGLACVLVIGAGLLVKSSLREIRTPPGFAATDVLLVDVALSPTRYATASAKRAYYAQTLSRLADSRSLVVAAAMINDPPFSLRGTQRFVDVPSEFVSAGESPVAGYRLVSADYFRALGISILRGRTFEQRDGPVSTRVFLVNAEFERRYFGSHQAIGAHIALRAPVITRQGSTTQPVYGEIVGVVSDIHHWNLDVRPEAEVYGLINQEPVALASILVHVRNRDAATVTEVVSRLRQIDRTQPVYHIRFLDDAVKHSASLRRITATVLALFSAIALIIAGFGIYGMVSQVASYRQHEFALRLALGAESRRLVRALIYEGVGPAWLGVSLGWLVSFGFANALGALLYDIPSRDSTIFVVVPLVLGLAAAIATIPGAKRLPTANVAAVLRYD